MAGSTDVQAVRDCLGDYLRQKGLPLRKPFRCLSPSHEDKHPSMSYHAGGNQVHCFGCGATYDLPDLVGLDYGITDFPGQLHKAAELMGLAVTAVKADVDKPGADRTVLLDELMEASSGDLSFFDSRGITDDSCRRFGFFQAKGRAYFPIFRDSVCTGWCGRALSHTETVRYCNSAGSLDLWNGDSLAEEDGVVCVTEGIVDAVSLIQLGYRAVALCGSQNRGKLLDRLTDCAPSQRFLLWGDGDEAGRRMNEALLTALEDRGFPAAAVTMPEDMDVNALYITSPEQLNQLAQDAIQSLNCSEKPIEAQNIQPQSCGFKGPSRPFVGFGAEPHPESSQTQLSAGASIADFFAQAERSRGTAISTGIDPLDKLLDGGLYPGLYVLGAIASLGKTSLALQMADRIAEHGRDVLFVSLEQSRFELMAKSMSRISFELGCGFTARQLLSGDIPVSSRAQVARVSDAYGKQGSRLFLREGMGDIGAAEIGRMVADHVAATGTPPVVVVDYLQILASEDGRATDKQNTDRAVVALKRLSRDYGIPVVAVSSFNRENYRTAVSMESFKESGAVEYSADVLLGMQLKGAGDKGLDLNAAKLRDPRQVELVVLKNRMGVPFGRVNLQYRAKWNLFETPARAAGGLQLVAGR